VLLCTLPIIEQKVLAVSNAVRISFLAPYGGQRHAPIQKSPSATIASNFHQIRNGTDRSTSPGRGGRVVTETESFMSLSSLQHQTASFYPRPMARIGEKQAAPVQLA
jgi:hypothetical protein